MKEKSYTPVSGDAERGERNVQIQKNLGLFSGISIIVGEDNLTKFYILFLLFHLTGTIIGSGIWVTPGFIMTYSGSVGVYLLQWAVCGVLSAMGRYYFIYLIIS